MTEKASNGALTVGQVAERFGVTVRTLHHYDEIGLVSPHRTAAGYRVYTDDDLERLRHVVVYRRLGFPLEEIAPLLDDRTPTSRRTCAGSAPRSCPGWTRCAISSRPSTEHWRRGSPAWH